MVTSTNEVISMQSKNHVNLSADELVKISLATGEGKLASNGALVVTTGARTGRSPKDRFIVKDHCTENTVDWNNINQALSPDKFDALWEKAENYLHSRKEFYTSYLHVGAHETLGIPVKVMTELA